MSAHSGTLFTMYVVNEKIDRFLVRFSTTYKRPLGWVPLNGGEGWLLGWAYSLGDVPSVRGGGSNVSGLFFCVFELRDLKKIIALASMEPEEWAEWHGKLLMKASSNRWNIFQNCLKLGLRPDPADGAFRPSDPLLQIASHRWLYSSGHFWLPPYIRKKSETTPLYKKK